MNRSNRNPATLAILLGLAGCGGTEPVATIEPEAPPPAVSDAPEPVAEPEPALSDRWRAPFAVSSVGEATPRERRGVTVIGADPAIAAAREAIEETSPTRVAGNRPPAGSDPAPAPSGAGPAPVSSGARPASVSSIASAGSASAMSGASSSPIPSGSAAAGAGRTAAPPAPGTGVTPPRGADRTTPGARGAAVGSTPTAEDRPAPGTLGELVDRPGARAAAASRSAADERVTPAASGADRGSDRRAAPAAAPAADPEDGRGARERDSDAGRRGPTTYTVEPGDSWLGIARDFGVTYSALAERNPGVDPERIRIGQILRIPASDGSGAGPRARARTYEVGPGDSLWGIARRFNVSTERLREANDISGDRIRLGQVLVIPPAEGDDR